MVSIDEFVNSLYKGVNGSQKEIKDFKEEMKSHLIETVNELKHEGKTEEESLKIAFERFGDSTVITNGLFKLFHKQKKFIGFILIFAIVFLLIGVTSYIFMSQKDLKFQKEQKILTQGVLDIVEDDNDITDNKKLQIETLVEKYNYINYIALFKVDDNPNLKEKITNDASLNMNGTYTYPFNTETAELVYSNNIKPRTNSLEGYDRSTVIATNKKWAVQYEYKESIYNYVENYSSRIVFSDLNYSTASFNYNTSIYFIIVGTTLLALLLVIRIYNKFSSRLFKQTNSEL